MKPLGNIYSLTLAYMLTVFLATGCSSDSGSSGSQQGWSAYNSNPIIAMGQDLTGAQWNDPSVIKSGSTYVMYLTANSTGIPGQDVLPFRATSADGITWSINTTSLLTPGNTNDFDEAGIETPSVIFFNGEYHMYYTGVGSGGLSGPLSIGHATSTDGVTWVKDPISNPVLIPTSVQTDWNGVQVGEPGAVIFNNQVYLFFTAVGLRPGGGTPLAMRTIGLAISTDGTSFGSQVQVLEQSARYPATGNYSGYSTPSALVYSGQLHLFYDVVQENPGFEQVALEHASSPDGITWAEDNTSIFVRSDFAWTMREIRSPAVINDGNLLKMWFAGDDVIANSIWGIGYASANAGIY